MTTPAERALDAARRAWADIGDAVIHAAACPHTDHRDCRGGTVTEILALTERPTVRLWDKHFNYVAGCELLGPPERAGDGYVRIRIARDSAVAQALLRDDMFSLDNITVDLPAGRFCGRMSEWATGDGLTITALDVSTSLARHIIPPAPPVHSLPPEPGPVVVTPEQVERMADRIERAIRADAEEGAYVGKVDNDGEVLIDGYVNLRKIASHLLMHPEGD